ncbi:MAG: hypothetical protein R2706_17395 [Acidimicrobiales bacterium]
MAFGQGAEFLADCLAPAIGVLAIGLSGRADGVDPIAWVSRDVGDAAVGLAVGEDDRQAQMGAPRRQTDGVPRWRSRT